jgi:hypothetical protein
LHVSSPLDQSILKFNQFGLSLMLKWMDSRYFLMTSGEIWLKWVLDHHQIVFDVNHMVDMVHLELNPLNPVDMVHLLDLVAMDPQDLVALDNLTFLELDNTLTSLEMVVQVETMVHQIINNAVVKLNQLVHLAQMDLLVKLALMV